MWKRSEAPRMTRCLHHGEQDLRKFPPPLSLERGCVICVTPARTGHSGPKSHDPLDVVSVSSTTSCRRPAATATASSFISARKSATARGWIR